MDVAAALTLRRQDKALPFSYHLPDIRGADTVGLSTARKNKIFISYAPEDVGFVRVLDRILRAKGHDPWIDFDDMVKGTTRNGQVQKGVQSADVFIFVVTPASVKLRRQELELALRLNKVLVLILWQPPESDDWLPSALNQIDWLQLTQRNAPSSIFDLELLIEFVLNLYAFAKLLVRSHVWQQQGYPQNLLLRPQDVAAVERDRDALGGFIGDRAAFLPEQQALIAASLDDYEQTADVLLSYSRKDRDFVEWLYQGLKDAGHRPWVDWNNIPVATEWPDEVEAGIQDVHTVIFVISPDSVVSPHCCDEIEIAKRFNKRIITVLRRSGYSRARLNKMGLGKIQYISFQESQDLTRSLLHLIDAIHTDIAHVKQHQRLLRRALEWDESRRDGFLMTPQQLKEVKLWLKRQERSPKRGLPKLTPLQKKYIAESDRSVTVKRRTWAIVTGIAAAVVLSLSAFSVTIAIEEIRALVNSLEDRRGLDALKVALKASKRLKQYGPLISGFRPKLQIRAVTALHREIYSLRASNYLVGHNGKAFSVAFSPNGEVLASGGEDGTVRFWDASGLPIATPLEGHEDAVVSVDFSAAGTLVASGSYDGNVILWTPDGQRYKTLSKPHDDRIIVISFSPGGQLLASASDDATVHLWRQEDDFQTPTILLHNAAVVGLSFSPYGDKVVTSDSQGQISLWATDGTLLKRFDNGAPVIYLEFSPDGKTIASADLDGYVNQYALDGKLRSLEDNRHLGIVNRATFSSSGRFFASAGQDGIIKVWTKTGELRHTLRGHLGAVYRLRFTSDERMLISAGADDTIKLWSVQQGLLLEEFDGHRDEILSMAITSGDKKLLASASASGTIILWKLNNRIHTLPHTNRVYAVRFRPDGRIIASGGRQTIRLWNQQGTPIAHIQATQSRTGGVVNSLDYSPDSRLLVSGDSDGGIKLWQPQLSTSKPLLEFSEGHKGEISTIRFSPDGAIVASASTDRTVKLWTVQGQLIDTLTHRSSVSDLAFVPGRKWLLTASRAAAGDQGDITVWALGSTAETAHRSAENLGALSSHKYGVEVGDVMSISVTPDEKMLMVGEADASVKLWNLDGILPAEDAVSDVLQGKGGTRPKILEAHREPVLDVGVSADGELLASASQDGTIKLWTRRGRLISTLSRHDREVSSLQFNPKANTEFASASYDNRVFLWRLPRDFTRDTLGLLITNGCSAVGSYLEAQNTVGGDMPGDSRETGEEMIDFCQSSRHQAVPGD